MVEFITKINLEESEVSALAEKTGYAKKKIDPENPTIMEKVGSFEILDDKGEVILGEDGKPEMQDSFEQRPNFIENKLTEKEHIDAIISNIILEYTGNILLSERQSEQRKKDQEEEVKMKEMIKKRIVTTNV